MVRITNAVESVIEEKAEKLVHEKREALRRKHQDKLDLLEKRWGAYSKVKAFLLDHGFRVDNGNAYPGQIDRWNYRNELVKRLKTHAIARINQLGVKATLDEAYAVAEEEIKRMIEEEVK